MSCLESSPWLRILSSISWRRDSFNILGSARGLRVSPVNSETGVSAVQLRFLFYEVPSNQGQQQTAATKLGEPRLHRVDFQMPGTILFSLFIDETSRDSSRSSARWPRPQLLCLGDQLEDAPVIGLGSAPEK